MYRKVITWKTFKKYCKLSYSNPPLCKKLVDKSKSKKEYDTVCRCHENNCPTWKRLQWIPYF